MTEDVKNMSSGELSSHIDNLQGQLASLDAGTDSKPAEKPGLFQHARDQELSAAMGKIHDRVESREDAVTASKDVPSARADSFDDAFAKTYDFLNSSKAEQARLRDAGKLVEDVKANALRFGVTLDDQAALAAAMDLEKQQAAESSSEHGQAAQHLQSAFRDSPPQESARFFADTKRALDTDLVSGLGQIAQHYGRHPMDIAIEIAQRYGHSPQQQHQSQPQAVAAMEAEIARVAESLPNYADHEADMLEIIPRMKRTNDPVADLKTAYREAVKRDGKLSSDQRLDKRLRRVYDKSNARGK